MTMDSIAEVVLCIESLKLKKKYFSSHISVCCSGQYSDAREVPYSTTVQPFIAGEVYGVPLVESLQGVLVTVYAEKKERMNGINRDILGSVLISIRSHVSSVLSKSIELDVLQDTVVIGKLVGKVALYSVKMNENKERRHRHRHRHRSEECSSESLGSPYSSDEDNSARSRNKVSVVQPVRSHPLREFRFVPMNKDINWDCIANLNLKKVVRSGNIPHFDHILNSVAYGNVHASASSCDPKLSNALKALQLSAQYISDCSEVLHSKQEMIADALKCFKKEEELLDRELLRRRYDYAYYHSV